MHLILYNHFMGSALLASKNLDGSHSSLGSGEKDILICIYKATTVDIVTIWQFLVRVYVRNAKSIHGIMHVLPLPDLFINCVYVLNKNSLI